MNDDTVAPLFQLRILSGMHAGACAPLEGDEYTLGALEECDFVLSDAGVQPRHARLSRLADGWQLDWVAIEGKEPVLAPMRMERGKAVPLGPIVVAVDEPDASWPTLEQLVLVPHAPALEPELPPPTEPARPKGRRWVGTGRRGAAAWVVTVAAAGTSALALVASPMGASSSSSSDKARGAPASAASVRVAPAPSEVQRRAIAAAVEAAGFTDRTNLEAAGDGWSVRAVALTDGEGEALGAALARFQPRPALHVVTEQDLRDRVMDMLLRIAPEYRGSVSLRYAGEGRFRLEGRMAKAGERDKLLRTLTEAFPYVRGWENAVSTGDDDANGMVSELRSNGWQISSAVNQGTLEMQVSLPQRDVHQWEAALAAAAKNHPTPFRAALRFVQGETAAPQNSESKLPFQIRGVVGGDMPYVLMPDGEKLSRGGTWQGWRLASVSGNQVVFENGARRAIVQR